MRLSNDLAQPSVSVIVPVYRAETTLRRCLASLIAATPSPNEIIVVADGDGDESWRAAEQFGAHVVRLSPRGGPARARNHGARIAQHEILFFVDADVTVHRDCIAKIHAAFSTDRHLAALIGSYDDAPTASNFLSQYKNLLHHYIHQTSCDDAQTFWGACGAIRRDTFMAIGGFDEAYDQPSIEDIELGYRLRQSGHTIRLDKTLQVTHLKEWGMISLIKADVFYRALPWTELIVRTGRLPNDLNLRYSSRVSTLAIYGLIAAFAATTWWPRSMIIALSLLLIFLVINAPLYTFFQQKRGVLLALQVIPWHAFYHLYSGFAFLVGSARSIRSCSMVKRNDPSSGDTSNAR